MMETERRLNGVSIDHKKERDSISISPKAESLATDLEADVQTAYIPVVLDKSSLPNSPDPTQLQNILESPVLGYHAQSPPIANPQIQKLIASEPLKSPIRQESLPPPNLQRKTSISKMAKEATEAIGRKMSLRSRRKNSQTGKEWKLEDIPKRKTSNASMDGVSVSAPPRSAIPDFPAPPTTTPLRSAPAEENRLLHHPHDDQIRGPCLPEDYRHEGDAGFLLRGAGVEEDFRFYAEGKGHRLLHEDRERHFYRGVPGR